MGPLWAVHIADGILTLPWLAGGFALAGVLALWGAYRVRDEEIPRIALLSAASFVASLLHMRLGPTSTHLLLNGLVGVILGRRAALAIPLGLLLQAALFGHGGFSTLGVNTCVLTIPALLCGWMFTALHRAGWVRRPAVRTLLIAVGALGWSLASVFVVVLIATNRWGQLMAPDTRWALEVTLHPITLASALLVTLVAVWAERRMTTAPEFGLGFLVGASAVLATTGLNALVLLLGGAEDWHQLVVLVVLAHLPLAVVEGVVLGFTVGFLARVQPELLGLEGAGEHWQPPAAEPSRNGITTADADITTDQAAVRPPAVLLALLTLGLTAGPARAHRLRADYRLLPNHKVQVETWYDITRESSPDARVEVFRPDKQLLLAGRTDDNGFFVFESAPGEPLRVVVSAAGGHRAEFVIPADAGKTGADVLNANNSEERKSFADRNADVSGKDVLLGLTFLLALSAFVLSLRNARKSSHRGG